MGISDDWGTAVTIQEMVFGNLSPNSGTGVFFTHNPRWSGDILKLWGDFTLANQGEDVVSGLVTTLPISLLQQETEMRETDITLETHFPEIYEALKMGQRIDLQPGLEPPGDGVHLRDPGRGRSLPAADPRHGHAGTKTRDDLRP
jgi:phosphoenolpyruvate synthase/pyruvate phosphate dikinase